MSDEQLNILITARYSAELLDAIRAIAPTARVITKDELTADPALIGHVDIVYGTLDRELFPRATRLKWLQTTFAGMEWTAAPEIRAHPVILTNARIHATPISEHLFGLLLMLTRQLHVAYRQQLEKHFDKVYTSQVDDLPGKTLCVVGLGVIGQRCAQLGKAFGMRVIGVRRHPTPTSGVEQVFGTEQLCDALAQADVVMVILPNTPATDHLIGREAFAAMKHGSYFLNAGRGKTVDTDALLAALRNGTLKGAGLDVTDPEPLPLDHPLWEQPNAIITPHYSGAQPDYQQHADRIFLVNLRRFVCGEELQFIVSKESGY